MGATKQLGYFGLLLCAAFALVMTIPQVWVKPVSDLVLIAVLAIISIDWIWLRVIQPGLDRRRDRQAGAS